jgi:hypothetical protein
MQNSPLATYISVRDLGPCKIVREYEKHGAVRTRERIGALLVKGKIPGDKSSLCCFSTPLGARFS